jgi:hypothetical protein
MKRATAATKRSTQGPNKWYGKVWAKEEVDIRIRPDKTCRGTGK